MSAHGGGGPALERIPIDKLSCGHFISAAGAHSEVQRDQSLEILEVAFQSGMTAVASISTRAASSISPAT
jgi:hypothetical protein